MSVHSVLYLGSSPSHMCSSCMWYHTPLQLSSPSGSGLWGVPALPGIFFFFPPPPAHFSSLSKPAVYITHNATRLPTVVSVIRVCYVAANVIKKNVSLWHHLLCSLFWKDINWLFNFLIFISLNRTSFWCNFYWWLSQITGNLTSIN